MVLQHNTHNTAIMNNAQHTAHMSNVTTTDFGYMTLTITPMPVSKKGRELGWQEQYKEVQTWGPDNGHMSGLVTTTYYWKGHFGKHVFRTIQKWA